MGWGISPSTDRSAFIDPSPDTPLPAQAPRVRSKGLGQMGSTFFSTLLVLLQIIGQTFYENLPKARKERQIAPQASAGYPLSINSLPAIRKASDGVLRKLERNSRRRLRELGRDICLTVAANLAFLLETLNFRIAALSLCP